jgi:NADPH:quinone reductase-like Zn-dependent oxidoreductase
MKAIICPKYGPPDILQFKEVETPTPKANEIRIRVVATTAARGDCELRGLSVPVLLRAMLRLAFGFRGPRQGILGQELAGEIESVGVNVRRFKKGDLVFALTGLHLGAYAEYDCLPEQGLVAIKPSNMTFEEAASVPVGGLHAYHFLSRGGIRTGQKVLIVGAGGSIGTFAVQIAKSLGADVTGVDATEKLEIIRSIGADHVIDYTKEDFTKGGEVYDVIFDAVGKSSFSDCIKSLKEDGRYLLGNPGLTQQIRARLTSATSRKKVVGGAMSYKTEDMTSLRELIEGGKVRSVIDRRYPLEEMVEAHRYVDSGQKKGNVVITVSSAVDEKVSASRPEALGRLPVRGRVLPGPAKSLELFLMQGPERIGA